MNTINEIQDGKGYNDIFVLEKSEVSTAKTGKDYLNGVITDKFGDKLAVRKWDLMPGEEIPKAGSLVRIAMTVRPYQGNLQGMITRIETVDPFTLENPGDYIPSAPEDPDAMWNEIMKSIDGFQNKDLAELTRYLLTKNEKKFRVFPAAKSVHHWELSGLIWHTVEVLRIAKGIANALPDGTVNKDLLYAGAILHDIGKLEEFTIGTLGMVEDYSSEGCLQGHLELGAEMLHDAAKELCVDPEVEKMVKHLILSHHKNPEYGAVKVPQMLEAELLHHADDASAKAYIFRTAAKNAIPGQMTGKVFGLDGRVYVPSERM